MMLSIYAAVGLAALLFLVLPSKRLPVKVRGALALLLLALSQVPVDGISLAGHWQASVGELAITTTLLLLTLAWRRLRGQRPLLPAGMRGPLMGLGVFALIFYPLSMGAGSIDPYRTGFIPALALALIFVVTLLLWWRGRNAFLVAALALATLAYAVDALPSRNYWDYLFDPVLAVFGLNLAIRRALQRWRVRRQKAQRQRVAAVAENA
ncbi:MAG: hypothetical protein ACOY3E_13790 [Pseudomonadota bacterium]